MKHLSIALSVCLVLGLVLAIFVWQERIPRKSLYLEKIVPYHRAVMDYYQKTGRVPQSLGELTSCESLAGDVHPQVALTISNQFVVLSLLDGKQRVLYQMNAGPFPPNPHQTEQDKDNKDDEKQAPTL